MIFFLIKNKNPAAITPPKTGDITQDAAIFPIVPQETIENPAAAIPAPITPPTIECVVDTGAPTEVAKLSHKAADSKAAVIAQINISGFDIKAGSIIPFLIVLTTSPPAINAPAASNIAAIIIAHIKVKAFDPTAGPTLLATSFAPIFIAI